MRILLSLIALFAIAAGTKDEADAMDYNLDYYGRLSIVLPAQSRQGLRASARTLMARCVLGDAVLERAPDVDLRVVCQGCIWCIIMGCKLTPLRSCLLGRTACICLA